MKEKGLLTPSTDNLPQTSWSDDLLVVAADNLLFFSFSEFVKFAKEKNGSCIMRHYQPFIEKLQRTGVVVLDESDKVLNMEEKPQEPKSHWAVPPFYIYLRKDLDLVRHSVENGCGKDAPGNLAHYMVDNTIMYPWEMKRTEEQQKEDTIRQDWLEHMGYTVLRFTNEQILFNTDSTIQTIKKSLKI